MIKKRFVFLVLLILTWGLFAAGLDPALYEDPVRYDPKTGETPQAFFEREYEQTWNSLSEYEQFAIACSSNVFERNNQFHLDYCNRVKFVNFRDQIIDGKPVMVMAPRVCWDGKKILEDNNIANYENLMSHVEGINERITDYLDYKKDVEENPQTSAARICAQKDLVLKAAYRIAYVRNKKDKLGKHNIEAWVYGRQISMLRWGIGAGFISEEEATSLIMPMVEKIKADYTSFEDFFLHWLAGYSYDFVEDYPEEDELNKVLDDLIKVTEETRAYIPFEKLQFTGENADKSHILTKEDLYYTPSEEAKKMNPLLAIWKINHDGKATAETIDELIKVERDDKDLSDLACNLHLDLLQKFSTAQERVKYLDTKWDYLFSLPVTNNTYLFAVTRYTSDLANMYKLSQLVDFYKSLPIETQKEPQIAFIYGYSNYQLANLSKTIIERDIYISRAITVFKQLQKNDYELGEFMENWMHTVDYLAQ